MGRRDYRDVTQRKPKTKGKGDELIDWTIEDLKKRWKLRTEQANIIKEQLLHGMDREPENITTPERKGITPIPSQEERRKTEEEEFARTHQSWQESNARQAYPATLPTSDAEFQMAQFNMNMQENLSTLAMQGQISISQAIKLSKMNGGAFETFNNMSYKAEIGENTSVFAQKIKAEASPDLKENQYREVEIDGKNEKETIGEIGDKAWTKDTDPNREGFVGGKKITNIQRQLLDSGHTKEGLSQKMEDHKDWKEARKRNVKPDVENKQLEQGF